MSNQPKPLIATYLQLAYSLRSLHRYEKAHLDNLHDIWMKGAPAPNSIIRDVKHNDPRKVVQGNYEARIVLPTLLTAWIMERAGAIGANMSKETALFIIDGMSTALSSGVNGLIQKGK